MLEKSGESQGILSVRKSENHVYISGVSESGDIFIANGQCWVYAYRQRRLKRMCCPSYYWFIAK